MIKPLQKGSEKNLQGGKKKKVISVGVQRTLTQFYSPYGEFYCFAVIFRLRPSDIAFGSFEANKIKLKPNASISLLPQGNNITLP